MPIAAKGTWGHAGMTVMEKPAPTGAAAESDPSVSGFSSRACSGVGTRLIEERDIGGALDILRRRLAVKTHLIAMAQGLPLRRRAKVFVGLMAAIRQWAASIGASHSFIHVTTGSNLAGTDRLMKAAGAKLIGGSYIGGRP